MELLNRISISPKNLRLCAIIIGIYHVLVSSFVLFFCLLGLSHAEATQKILKADLEEHEDYITSLQNVSVQAEDLAYSTLVVMYTFTTVAAIYALCTWCLVLGIHHNRSELLLPWMIYDMVGMLLFVDLMITFRNSEDILKFVGGHSNYWITCGFALSISCCIWIILHSYYSTLRRMKKLNESAVIPIPCPPPHYYPPQGPLLNQTEKQAMLTDVVVPQ